VQLPPVSAVVMSLVETLAGIPPLATLPIPAGKVVMTSMVVVLTITFVAVRATPERQPGPRLPVEVTPVLDRVALAGTVVMLLASIRTPVRMIVPVVRPAKRPVPADVRTEG